MDSSECLWYSFSTNNLIFPFHTFAESNLVTFRSRDQGTSSAANCVAALRVPNNLPEARPLRFDLLLSVFWQATYFTNFAAQATRTMLVLTEL